MAKRKKKPKMTKKEKTKRAKKIWAARRKNFGKTGLPKSKRAKK